MKKVLVITYYWPPSGGGGVQRWLKFTKYLPEFGWQPIVLTPSNPSVLEQDSSLMKDIDGSTKVVKIPIWEPYSLASKLLQTETIPKQGIVKKSKDKRFSLLAWLRGNFLIPDTRIFWKSPAVKKAREIIETEHIDLVVTTGPPHSLHLIGLALKKRCKIPWIADFRDPWSDWDILEQMKLTTRSRRIHAKLEAQVIDSADGVLTVSNTWAKDLSEKHQKSIKVITNGFEVVDLSKADSESPEKFRISHFGLINDLRNVSVFWAVLAELCVKDESFAHDLEVFLAGNVEEEILEKIMSSNLYDSIKIAGYIPHEKLIEEYNKTAVFLLLTNNSKNAKGHIPGKVFEYLHFRRPILAFCKSGGDVAGIIENTKSGIAIDPGNIEQLRHAIEELYTNYKKGNILSENSDISNYERKNLCEHLALFFNEVCVGKVSLKVDNS